MSFKRLPKLIVFDLDYTLWPFWVDTHVTPPFHNSNGDVVDARGKKVLFYPEVPQILEYIKKLGCDIGVASRTSEIDGANQLMKLFNWDEHVKFKEIYPGSKIAHFREFKKKSGYNYDDMLFFDDEQRNIVDLEPKKVICLLVEHGMTIKELERGLRKFSG